MQVHIPMHSVEPVGSVTVWLKTVIQYDENIMSNEVAAVKLSTRDHPKRGWNCFILYIYIYHSGLVSRFLAVRLLGRVAKKWVLFRGRSPRFFRTVSR